LGINLRKCRPACNSTHKRDTCTSTFIEALFTIAKLWNQHRYPTADEWIKKTHTTEYYSAMKRNETMPFARK
jgi:hypothetical protein